MPRTKIVCTLGPATDVPGLLPQMIQAGMEVARLNFSHGSHTEHAGRIAQVRQAAQETRHRVAIMLDTSGPEVRTGILREGGVLLEKGQSFILTTEEVAGDSKRVSVSFPQLPAAVSAGQTILLDDGLIQLLVQDTTATEIRCQVVNGGRLTDRRGVNIPGADLPFPILTEKDRADLLFGVKQKVDLIAASFVRSAQDVRSIRSYLASLGGRQFIVAKIESRQGLERLEEILEEADGLMVARGDLGVEIPPEQVPLVQKEMIRRCNQAGKPVITATQMLDSMIRNPRPTRAEASDVANAILDGTDAIMLSGETAAGAYPLEAVETMARIARRTESNPLCRRQYSYHVSHYDTSRDTTSEAVARAACLLAEQIGAKAILTSTQMGFTARQVARFRPSCPILATTPLTRVCHQLNLSWGVTPCLVDFHSSTDEMIRSAIQAACQALKLCQGDTVVITAGIPAGQSGSTNLIKVHRIGEPLN